jgi:hypothetical protein
MNEPTLVNVPVRVVLTINPETKKIRIQKVAWQNKVWVVTKSTFEHTEILGYNRKLYVFSATAAEETGSTIGRRATVGMELTLDNTMLWDFRLRNVLYQD